MQACRKKILFLFPQLILLKKQMRLITKGDFYLSFEKNLSGLYSKAAFLGGLVFKKIQYYN